MRVLCTYNSGRFLSSKHFEAGYTTESEFDLEIGKEYIVYGMNLWKGLLGYLIVVEGSYPRWYPSEVFTVTRKEIPAEWYFSRFEENEGFELNAIWGYNELVNEESHYDDLSNLEKSAISIFLENKKQIDGLS